MKTIPSVVLALSVFLLGSSPARATVVSIFNVDSEGWTLADISQPIANPPTIVGGGSVIYQTAEGNPAGSIATADISGNATFFRAPAKFIGDVSSALGTTFSYDIRLQTGVGETGAAVMMVGGGLTLLGGAGNVPTAARPAPISCRCAPALRIALGGGCCLRQIRTDVFICGWEAQAWLRR